MARVLPFVGTRYNSQMVDISRVVSPPYDVIDADLQEKLYEREAHNIVRVILGKQQREDDDYNNKYQRAASYLREWSGEGVLLNDSEKCFYVYRQQFTIPGGQELTRTGFFAAIRLEDPEKGNIRGHEHTFEGPKADRLNLTRATACNLGPIFCLYSEPERQTDEILAQASQGKPVYDFQADDGVRHSLWLLTDKPLVKRLSSLLQGNEFFIADGHHRYETAVRYAKEMSRLTGRTKGECPSYTYTLAFLTNCEAPGLQILPTHRLLSQELGEDVEREELLEDLQEYFKVREIKFDPRKAAQEGPRLLAEIEALRDKGTAFCLALPDGLALVLELRKDKSILEVMPEDKPEEVNRLDVSILHDYLISQLWVGNPEIELDDSDVFYVKDPAEAVAALCAPRHCSAAILMNPPRMDQVREIAGLGLRMPHKTTYFYPKLLTGLVLRDLNAPW